MEFADVFFVPLHPQYFYCSKWSCTLCMYGFFTE